MSACSVAQGATVDGDRATVPLERLETEITTLSGQLSAATCRLLGAIAAYDRREGWATWECRSMSDWLVWRTAMSAPAAREHVRVARALEGLPIVTEAFSAGRLSYSQVRALTRVAVAATEADLVDLARAMTGSQLDRLVARYRGVRAATTDTAQSRRARRSFSSYLDDDGTRVFVVRLVPEDAERVLGAVDAATQAAQRAREAAPATPEAGIHPDDDDSLAARRADAFVDLVDRAAARHPAPLHDPAQALVVIHADTAVLRDHDPDGACHSQQGVPLAADTARRVACDSTTMTATDHDDGTTDFGRRSRRIPAALRRAVTLRDHTCVFPGCNSVATNEIHHVQHWINGGPTTLSNLALVCRFHHHRLHEGGYRMRPGPGQGAQRWTFQRPDGRDIPAAWDPPDHLGDWLPAGIDAVDQTACTPEWDGTRVDHNWIIEHLLITEGLWDPAFTPPPPAPHAAGRVAVTSP